MTTKRRSFLAGLGAASLLPFVGRFGRAVPKVRVGYTTTSAIRHIQMAFRKDAAEVAERNRRLGGHPETLFTLKEVTQHLERARGKVTNPFNQAAYIKRQIGFTIDELEQLEAEYDAALYTLYINTAANKWALILHRPPVLQYPPEGIPPTTDQNTTRLLLTQGRAAAKAFWNGFSS